MTILQGILLGIIQGLTEFFPVSSSGHLLLMRKLLGITGDYLFFDTMLHVGTLVAVCFAFWKDIVSILKKPFQKLTYMLILATVPAIIFSLLFEDFFDAAFEGAYLGYGFLLTALLLTLAEKVYELYKSRDDKLKSFPDYKESLIMGLAQACAIVPGLSRSGSTIAGGILSRTNRESAARFSFLMSIPAILGSVVLQNFKLITEGDPDGIFILPTVFGILFAAVFGYIAVRFLYNIIKKKNLYGFAVYTFVLGLIVIIFGI